MIIPIGPGKKRDRGFHAENLGFRVQSRFSKENKNKNISLTIFVWGSDNSKCANKL